MDLDKDFREFIELLNDHGVDYLVIGGYAVNYKSEFLDELREILSNFSIDIEIKGKAA